MAEVEVGLHRHRVLVVEVDVQKDLEVVGESSYCGLGADVLWTHGLLTTYFPSSCVGNQRLYLKDEI